MSIPVQITFRGMAASDALRSSIEQHVEKLEQFSSSIIGCHVTVEQLERRHRKGNRFNMHVQVQVPGQDIYVSNDPSEKNHSFEDPYVTLRDTFHAVTRQLEDYERQRRGDIKRHSLPQEPELPRH